MIKVVIADDQLLVAQGIKYLIEKDGNIEVVGCACDGEEALKICEKLNPDIVLMDIKMPGCSGIQGVKMIKQKHKDIKVVMLTTFCDDDSISKAMNNGADGYVLKDIKPNELINTIKSTVNGLRVVHQNV